MTNNTQSPDHKNFIIRFLTMNTSGETGGRDLPLWRQILLQLVALFILAEVMFPTDVHHHAVVQFKNHAPLESRAFPKRTFADRLPASARSPDRQPGHIYRIVA